MSDRERVIYDIERCICHVPDACQDCSKYVGAYTPNCMEQLLADALGLLKKQEARVLTPEELKAYDGYCWLEQKDEKTMGVSLIKDGRLYDFGEFSCDVACLNWEQYGKGWRYWSAQPSDEQRKAVKWE